MGRLHCHVSRCVISRALQFRPMRANQHIGAVCSRSTSLLHTWSDQGSHCSRRAVPLCQLITGEQVPAGRPSTPAAPGGTHPRPVPALPACAHALACTEWPSWYSHLPAATHHHHSGSGVCCCARQTSHQPLADLSGSTGATEAPRPELTCTTQDASVCCTAAYRHLYSCLQTS